MLGSIRDASLAVTHALHQRADYVRTNVGNAFKHTIRFLLKPEVVGSVLTIAFFAGSIFSCIRHYENTPLPEEIIEPECSYQNQEPSSWPIQALKESFVLSTLKNEYVAPYLPDASFVANKALQLSALALTYLYGVQGPWLQRNQNERSEDSSGLNPATESNRLTRFQARLEQTLNPGVFSQLGISKSYQIENIKKDGESSSLIGVLKNRFGYPVAILKKWDPSWKELFIREFNQDGFFPLPQVKTIQLPQFEFPVVAVEYVHGRGSYQHTKPHLYKDLSPDEMMTAVEQRQRIFMLDWLFGNFDRWGGNILLGCENEKIKLYALDHDQTFGTYAQRIENDLDLNPYTASFMSLENSEYIRNLKYEDLERIEAKYSKEIDKHSHTKDYRYEITNPDGFVRYKSAKISRLNYMKLNLSLMKMAIKKGLTIGQMNAFAEKINSEILPHKKAFMKEVRKYGRQEISRTKLYAWLEENSIFEKFKVYYKKNYRF